MFRAILGGTAIASGSYVVYHVFDHPVVKADAIALLQGPEQENLNPSLTRAIQSALFRGFQRWIGAFQLNDGEYLQSQGVHRQADRESVAGTERELFPPGQSQACMPFGSYADTSESKVLRFAVPSLTKHVVADGMFTVKSANSLCPDYTEQRQVTSVLQRLIFVLRILKNLFLPFLRFVLLPFGQFRCKSLTASLTIEDMTVSVRDEYFPLFGESDSHFDIHAWNRIASGDLFRSHDSNKTFFFQISQKLCKRSLENHQEIVLVVDPFGVAGAVQLIERLCKSSSMSDPWQHDNTRSDPPRIRVFYVKPAHWEFKSALDNRLQDVVNEYRCLYPSSNTEAVCVSSDVARHIRHALELSTKSTMVIALLTHDIMQSFKRIDVANILREKSSGSHVLRLTLS